MKINEKNLIHFVNCDTPVDREGWLFKKGEVNKSFQKRWFVLKGNLLFYFERKGDKEPAGLIILEGCTIELAENDDQFTFNIVFHGAGNRIYMLCADNQDDMEGWMKALACASYDYMKLMVAELERQLEEIDNQQKIELQEALTRSQSVNNIDNRPPKNEHKRINPFGWWQNDQDEVQLGTSETNNVSPNVNCKNDNQNGASDTNSGELEVFSHRQFAELHEYYGKQLRKYFDEQRLRALNKICIDDS